MHIYNHFVVVCNIQIVIQMLCHSFETLLLLNFFYLMVKSGRSFVKIRSPFQIAPFLYFIEISNPSSPPLVLTPRQFDFTQRSNPSPPCLLGPPVYSEPKSR